MGRVGKKTFGLEDPGVVLPFILALAIRNPEKEEGARSYSNGDRPDNNHFMPSEFLRTPGPIGGDRFPLFQ